METIRIIETELPPGIAGETDGYTIWISPHLTYIGRRCTLAHELVHISRGMPPPGLEDKEEHKVDRITARILAPHDALLDALVWTQGDHALALAHELDLDLPTLRARLRAVTPPEGSQLDQALDDLGQAA